MFLDDLVRRYIHGEADIKIEGILGKLLSKNCTQFDFPTPLPTYWLSYASGLRFCFACDPFDFRFRPQENGAVVHPYRDRSAEPYLDYIK